MTKNSINSFLVTNSLTEVYNPNCHFIYGRQYTTGADDSRSRDNIGADGNRSRDNIAHEGQPLIALGYTEEPCGSQSPSGTRVRELGLAGIGNPMVKG